MKNKIVFCRIKPHRSWPSDVLAIFNKKLVDKIIPMSIHTLGTGVVYYFTERITNFYPYLYSYEVKEVTFIDIWENKRHEEK